jgi:hypothetical protein
LGENKVVDNSGDIDNQPEPEIEVEVEGEEPAPKPEVKEPDEAPKVSALQKQLDDLRKSEELMRTNHEQALLREQEALRAKAKAEGEAQKYRSDSEQSSLDAINNALSAARSEIESAERELESAIANADAKAQAMAYRKIAKAESNIGRLEDGQAELEYRIKVSKNERQREVETSKTREEPKKQDIIDNMPVPDRAKEWLREHREYAENPRKNAKLQVVHWDALDEGHKEFSTGYFNAVERLLGIGSDPEVEADVEEEQPRRQETRRTSIVSAPVSRDGPSSGSTQSSTKIRLNKEQSEFAKMSGLTDAEYAKQLIKLQEMKKAGSYGEGR